MEFGLLEIRYGVDVMDMQGGASSFYAAHLTSVIVPPPDALGDFAPVVTIFFVIVPFVAQVFVGPRFFCPRIGAFLAAIDMILVFCLGRGSLKLLTAHRAATNNSIPERRIGTFL